MAPSPSTDEKATMIYLKICKTVALQTGKSETVKELKSLIHVKQQIHEDNQELSFADKRLKVNYNITKNSTLHLTVQDSSRTKLSVHIPRNRKTISVEAREWDRTLVSLSSPREPTFHLIYKSNDVRSVVVNVSGNGIKVEVNLLYTVQDAKSIVASMMKKVSNWCSFYGEKLLENSKRLACYKVEENRALEMRSSNIKIFVKFWDGSVTNLDVEPLDTVGEVKKQILRKANLLAAIDSLELLHLGHVLVEHRKLGSYFWKKQDHVLEMRPRAFQIFVKLWNGKTITLDVHQLSTIREVKLKILEKENVSKPIRSLRLRYEGKVLANDRVLASYNIQKDSTLHSRIVVFE